MNPADVRTITLTIPTPFVPGCSTTPLRGLPLMDHALNVAIQATERGGDLLTAATLRPILGQIKREARRLSPLRVGQMVKSIKSPQLVGEVIFVDEESGVAVVRRAKMRAGYDYESAPAAGTDGSRALFNRHESDLEVI